MVPVVVQGFRSTSLFPGIRDTETIRDSYFLFLRQSVRQLTDSRVGGIATDHYG